MKEVHSGIRVDTNLLLESSKHLNMNKSDNSNSDDNNHRLVLCARIQRQNNEEDTVFANWQAP